MRRALTWLCVTALMVAGTVALALTLLIVLPDA
jgi:hypothetical protein